MTVHLQWQEKKAPGISSPRACGSNRDSTLLTLLHCRVVMAMTPPMLPVPNFVVASHER